MHPNAGMLEMNTAHAIFASAAYDGRLHRFSHWCLNSGRTSYGGCGGQ